MATKVSPFMANYRRELRMGGDFKKKEKVGSATKFVERMKKVHEEAGAALKKAQEEMKRYADQSRKEMEEWRQDNAKYKELSIQGKTGMQVDGEVCETI